MTSVPDIPGDADDDLSGISPELVLVDPELARLVREREPALLPAPPKRTPTLRLVPAKLPEPEPAVVPPPTPPALSEPAVAAPPEPAPAARAAPPEPTPVASPEPDDGRPGESEPAPSVALAPSVVPPAPTVDVRPEPPVDVRPEPPGPPEPPSPAVERVIEAEPVWMVEPALPAPAETAELPPAPRPAAIPPAMPHPVSRPAAVARQVRPRGPRQTRGRRAVALIAAIAVASLAVFGITQRGGGVPFGPSGAGEATAVPPGTPPTAPAKKTAHAKPKAGATTKPPAKASVGQPKKASTQAKSSSASGAARTRAAATGTAAKAKASQKGGVKTKTTAAAKPKAAKTKAAKTKAAAATAPAAAEPRRFAWAPVTGAIGYHVELFKGANRVLAKETTEPVLEIGQSWRYEGRTNRLTPGSYRWYVWPVTTSGRSTQAVVQATLDVP